MVTYIRVWNEDQNQSIPRKTMWTDGLGLPILATFALDILNRFKMQKRQKTFLAIGAFSMALAVAFGALGAHALKAVLDADKLVSFTTGVRYQAWHSLALILVQCIPVAYLSSRAAKSVSILMVVGILFFSFSIYTLSLRDVIGLSDSIAFIGPITLNFANISS